MKQLQTMNLSHNNLSGSTPSTFGDSASLTSIDISYKELEGPIPNITAFHKVPIAALKNNKGLCGNVAGLKACPKMIPNPPSKRHNRFLVIILISLLGTLFFYIYHCRSLTISSPKSEENIRQAKRRA